MTCVVISQPMYFPWVGFFEQMRLADVYVWLDDVQFSKGSFTNRVQVLLDGRQVWMTIPLLAKTNRDICDLVPKDAAWKASHRDLLSQSFKGKPFLADALAAFDGAMVDERVVDVLIASAQACAEPLGARPALQVRSSGLGIDGRGSQRVLDIVRHFGGSRYLTGHGAARYLDITLFEATGVAVEFMDYQVRPWPQSAETFTPYVTALDLIASVGDAAPDHLDPQTIHWRDFVQKPTEVR